MPNETPTVAELNDALRTEFQWGQVLMTRSVAALREDIKAQVVFAVQSFDDFTPDNDPYGEHDFWKVVVNGESFFWKVDYYNQDMTAGSENPADPNITQRVMTIMEASEY